MSTIVIGIVATLAFLAWNRVASPLIAGNGVDTATPFSGTADVLYPLLFGLLLIILVEGALWAGL